MPNASLFARLALAAAVGLAVLSHAARAEDIDIYSLPSTQGLRPNVLFVIDNTANWGATIRTPLCNADGANVDLAKEEGTKMGAEKCALYKVIKSMKWEDLGQYNLGFMLFNESPDAAAYPRQAFITVQSDADKQRLLNFISQLNINNDKGNNPSTAEAFYEAWLYFTSNTVRYGNKTAAKHDDKAFTDGSKTRYAGPDIGCTKNHIIYLANGAPNDNNTTAYELLRRINPSASRTRIPISEGVGNNDEANWSDEFAAFFNRGADLSTGTEGAQNISVHTIAVTGASSDGNYANYIRWIAAEGGGVFKEATDSNSIIVGLTDVLNQIRSADSVFSSASLPVSANTQGTYLNQVFIGMFRPDGNALPRWVGNLKQYKFIYDAQLDQLQLADVNGKPAVTATNGFITSSATSIWTSPSSFWINKEAASNGAYSRSDAPDGELVEKGGVAQWLRTSYSTSAARAARPVYTCVGSDCDSGGPGVDLAAAGSEFRFNTSNGKLNPDLFKIGFSSTQRDLLVNWVRGEENVTPLNAANSSVARDQLTTPPTGTNVRPAIHGDVLHSRPVAINYGTPHGVVVYYGSNEGLFRAVTGSADASGGNEIWSFVAPEHFGKLNRLRENAPEVRYPSTPSGGSAEKRDYFFDGPIGAYQNTITKEVMIFPTMRRGGRSVYAFNVSTPNQPRLLWRIGPDLSDYSTLGQTWSMPRVAMVKDSADSTGPVLIMGGGYDDGAEDKSPPGATTVGRGVYVINMRTGARLALLPTDYSVPADVAIVDSDGDGFVDRAYVVDVRAQLYRIDLENADGTSRTPRNWVITKIAALNDGTGGTNGTRKVFFAPDVVLSRNYASLLLGTGDREKPLSMTSNDRFYVIKDAKVTKGAPASVSMITDDSLAALGTTDAGLDPEGCSYQFTNGGEKVINQPITFGGITYFSTNQPLPPGAGRCSRAQNRAYQVPLVCRAPTHIDLKGEGLPPSPVVGYVDVGGGKLVPFVIGGANDKNSSIEVNRANIPIPAKRKRSYWFIDNRDR